MPRFVLIYDLHTKPIDPHDEFKAQAEALGWTDYIVTRGGTRHALPETTLAKVFEDVDQAETSFKQAWAKASQSLGTTVSFARWIIVRSGGTRSYDEKAIAKPRPAATAAKPLPMSGKAEPAGESRAAKLLRERPLPKGGGRR